MVASLDAPLLRQARSTAGERAVEGLLLASLGFSVVGVVAVAGDLVTARGALATTTLPPEAAGQALDHVVRGTAVAAIAAAVALPVGLAAGVALAELVPTRLRQASWRAWGVLSIAAGVLALAWCWRAWGSPDAAPGSPSAVLVWRDGIACGAVGATLVGWWCRRRLASVPDALRDAAYSLGSTRADAALRAMLPAVLRRASTTANTATEPIGYATDATDASERAVWRPVRRAAEPGVLVLDRMSVRRADHSSIPPISVSVSSRGITALVGPRDDVDAVLRCCNRMIDLMPGTQRSGRVTYRGRDLNAKGIAPVEVRRHIGMVAAQPVLLGHSVRANVAFGLRACGLRYSPSGVDALVEEALRRVGLWRVCAPVGTDDARSLHPAEQQLLCLARAIATGPELLLVIDPCAALEGRHAQLVEETLADLSGDFGILLGTSCPRQAGRLASSVAVIPTGQIPGQGRIDGRPSRVDHHMLVPSLAAVAAAPPG
jgi:phosphate transport system ATP-binding protein